MAKGQQKGNREKRKPKADKPKPPAQTASFGRGLSSGSLKGAAAKKGR